MARVADRLRLVAAVGYVVVLAVGIEIGLRTTTLSRVTRRLGVTLGLDGQVADGDYRPTGDAAAVVVLTRRERDRIRATNHILRRRPFDGTCLRRSLIAGHVLRRHGAVLRVGVAKNYSAVTAHAWAEIAGISLDPDAPTTYAVLEPTGPEVGGIH